MRETFVRVDCKENIGRFNEPSILDCMIKPTQKLEDLTVNEVVWRKDNKAVLVFIGKKVKELTKGYSFAEPSFNSKSLNISMLIANTAVSNHGNYTVSVGTDRGNIESSASLDVTAKYKTPIILSAPANGTRNSQVTLTCRSEGGYPKGQLSWSIGDDVQQNINTVAKEMETGLYSLSSELTFWLGQDPSKIKCVVFNANGGKDYEAIVTIANPSHFAGRAEKTERGLDVATKVVAPVVVIGSLVVGLLLFLVLKIKCLNYRIVNLKHFQNKVGWGANEEDSASFARSLPLSLSLGSTCVAV
nr:CD276 antigen homolog [Nerophis lumbriciformis]